MRKKFFLEILIGCLGFVLIWVILTDIFQPKYLFHSTYSSPETEMWTDFYKQPNDSLDALYVGSSHVYNGLNPIIVYQETGVTGFDLATSAQDIATAYFLIKEALRYQSPQYIFLDTYGFHFESLLLKENYTKTLDGMRWSSVKYEAIRAWQQNYPEESIKNRVLTLLDFHSRWDELNQNDFDYRRTMQQNKGYSLTFDVMPIEFAPADDNADIVIHEVDEVYLQKIQELCDENGIELVLMTTPHADWTSTQAATMLALAHKLGLDYYNFCDQSFVENCGLDVNTDFRDRNHLNAYGANKFSTAFADIMKSVGVNAGVHEDAVTFTWEQDVARINDLFGVTISD